MKCSSIVLGLAFVLSAGILPACQPVSAAQTGGFADIEFFGASAITRKELEKDLGLKPGASYVAVARAVERLRNNLQKRRIKANIDIESDDKGIFVTVDVLESGANRGPVRKLSNPRHIALASDVPFTIYGQLMNRLELLASQGKSAGISYPQGIKRYADEVCDQYADKLLLRVPHMIERLEQVVASDPDASRRSTAIELLNWGGDYSDRCRILLPALSDASEQVRVSAARFIYPRIKMLPDDFPFDALLEALSQQLARPSHIDRKLALSALSECARQRPETLYIVKEFDFARLKQLAESSKIESISTPAGQLVQTLTSLPDKPPTKHVSPPNEF